MDIIKLKKEIDEIIKSIAVNDTLLYFINKPSQIDKIFSAGNVASFPTKKGHKKEIQLDSALQFCRSNPAFNLMYLKKVLMVEINWVFTNLSYRFRQSYRASYGTTPCTDKKDFSKEFEFFRHIRDACAHGNTFNLEEHKPTAELFDKTKNPHYEATWNGFSIYLGLDKSELFFDFMQCGDAIELLEFVKDHI